MASVVIGSATAGQIVAANPQRISLIIFNEGSSKIYIDKDSTVTTATAGLVIASRGNFTEDGGERGMYLGAYFGISEDATNDVRYWERTRL